MALPTPLQAFSGVPKNTASADKQTIIDGEKMTGAQALIRALEDLGVQDVFGLPGGGTVPNTAHRTYAELADAEKDAISLRGRAMEKLEAELAAFLGE